MKIINKLILATFFIYNSSQAQVINNSYAVIKRQYLNKEQEAYDSSSNLKVKIVLKECLYDLVKISSDTIELSEPFGSIEFKIARNKIILIDSQNVKSRRKLLSRQLKKIANSYSKSNKLKNERLDTIDYSVLVKDSISDYLYSPVRNQLVKSWLIDKDTKLLTMWLKFLKNYLFDDALDAKNLTFCFLKQPREFSEQLNMQNRSTRKYIANYMLGSSGFQYATNDLELNLNESIRMFKDMVIVK